MPSKTGWYGRTSIIHPGSERSLERSSILLHFFVELCFFLQGCADGKKVMKAMNHVSPLELDNLP